MDGFIEAARDRDAYHAMVKMKPFETVPVPMAVRILKRIAEVNGLELDEEKLAGDPDGDSGRAKGEEVRWPAPEVVRFAEEIAERGGTRPDIALMLSTNSSTYGLDAKMVRLRDLREQRLLPKGRDLELLQRYESGLERSLFRTLHELERLQAHRNGGTVPMPIAVDVTGAS